jgi:hypothetical protein
MKHASLLLLLLNPLALSSLYGQGKPAKTISITLVSVQRMKIGEAYDCPSIDMQWLEAHCFPPTRENLDAPKHKYLVRAAFDKPIETDKNGWAWDFTCRLDSYKEATCQVNQRAK